MCSECCSDGPRGYAALPAPAQLLPDAACFWWRVGDVETCRRRYQDASVRLEKYDGRVGLYTGHADRELERGTVGHQRADESEDAAFTGEIRHHVDM